MFLMRQHCGCLGEPSSSQGVVANKPRIGFAAGMTVQMGDFVCNLNFKALRVWKPTLFLLTVVAFAQGGAQAQGGTWQTLAPMPTARFSLASGAVNGTVYALGGVVQGSCNAFNTVEAYAPQLTHGRQLRRCRLRATVWAWQL